MNSPYPTYEDIMSACEELAREKSDWVTFDEIGKSEQGRAVPLMKITDPAVPAGSKSVFLATGGTHGSEEAGRAITCALARWLLEPQNRTHLERQVFLIMPCVNPDGAILNTYHNAKDVNIYQAYPLDAPPLCSEAKAVLELAEGWIPDCCVDCHGLAGGAMGDGEYIHPTVNRDWSLAVSGRVSREMDQAAERAGFPQRVPHYRLEDDGSLVKWLARNHSALTFTVETTENYYPIEDTVRSGLARLTRLIEIGEETACFQPYPNYPCDVVSGNRMGALMPLGTDYTTRRKCRRDISRMIVEGVPHFGRRACDHDWTAVVAFPVEDAVRTLPAAIVLQATLDRRAEVVGVRWNGEALEPEAWCHWYDGTGLVVRAEVNEPPRKGENKLEISYAVPFKRHVEPVRK